MDNQDLDFDSVDTALLRSPNAYADVHDISESMDMLFDDKKIPNSVVEHSETTQKGIHVDVEPLPKLLEYAANAQGVMVSATMKNTAMALAHKFGLDANSMEWFVAGIVYANNNMLLEKMASAIKELQVEVKNIQSASSIVKMNADTLSSTMKSNKQEIVKELDKTRDSVLQALGSITDKTETVQRPGKAITVGIAQGKAAMKKLSAGALPPPQQINPELTSPILTKAIPTKSPEETVYQEKEKLLLDLGFEVEDVAKFNPLMMDIIVTDDMMAAAQAGLDEEMKGALQDQAIDNQITYEQLMHTLES
ncbi:TPA_asm: P [Primula alphacytorhabdovirus 1]|nr:TPA_asm: P [Primula alphacytorhabdovirus 1]